VTITVNTAARKVREWTDRRDDLIRAEVAAGKSQRAVAIEAKLSHTAVQKIVARGSQGNA
jgi:hypothetical protein